jgi:hypothetical protein
LHGVPQLLIDDTKLRQLCDDALARVPDTSDALARLGVPQIGLLIPDHRPA